MIENILNTYDFRIIDGIYPDMTDYKYDLSLPDVNINASIVEQWSTGELYFSIPDTSYQIPLRYNTNLLPSLLTNYTLYYDLNKQMFIFSELV